MKKVILFTILLGYLVADGAIAKPSTSFADVVKSISKSISKTHAILAKSYANTAQVFSETAHMYSSATRLHLLSMQIKLFDVRLAQFSDTETIEASAELRQELIELYAKIQNFHYTYSPNPKQDWYDPQLFIVLELWLKRTGQHLELLLSWKDGDRKKAAQLLLDLADEGRGSLTPEDINKLKNFLSN